MKTTVIIADVGTCSRVEIEAGKMTVSDSGGCPAETILSTVDFGTRRKIKTIAHDVLASWRVGYDGSPAENNLRVKIERNGKSVEVVA